MRIKTKKRARRAAALLALLVAMCALSGCVKLVGEEETQAMTVYATFYPIYALTEGVMRGVPDATLHCLVQPQDGCLRAYQLSDWDVALLSRGANAVIMGGRGLESFEDALFGWGESGPALSAVLYNLNLYSIPDAAGGDSEAESHLKGPNPHLYLSVEGAKEILRSISATMQELDPRYADSYIQNAQDAVAKLDSLLAENRRALEALKGRRVVVMNEALVYPALDYGLDIAGWIERESGESMADQALDRCLERLGGMEAQVLLIERQAPKAFVDALEEAGYAVARLDVLSTHREGEGFDAYLEAQRGNAQAILDAFGRADAGRDGQ